MKTVRIVIGVFSFILFIIIAFQSCAAGMVIALSENTKDMSGAAGFWLAVFMLAGGIVGIATNNSKSGGVTAGVLYAVGAVLGFASRGIFGDLVVWSIIAAIFGLTLIIGSAVADLRNMDMLIAEMEMEREDAGSED